RPAAVAREEHAVPAVPGGPLGERGPDAGRRTGDERCGHGPTLLLPLGHAVDLVADAATALNRAGHSLRRRTPRPCSSAVANSARSASRSCTRSTLEPSGAVASTHDSSPHRSSTSSPRASAAVARRGVSSGRTAAASETNAYRSPTG